MSNIEDVVDSSQNSTKRDFLIPQINGESSSLSMSFDDVIFILGPNGSGKSSLMQYIFINNNEKTLWISSLRQTFFAHGVQIMSSFEKHSTEDAIRGRERSSDYRYTDEYAGTKPNLLITDLITMERIRNQKIARLFEDHNIDEAEQYVFKNKSPLNLVNQLLVQSNIPITLVLDDNEKIIASKKSSEPYSIAQLSDGERSIVLLASQILSAPSNTLILIDEPERHLHQSIVSPLLKTLFSVRSDCAFVISTHATDLPMDYHNSKILLVRDCEYKGKNVVRWDTVLVESRDEIEEDLLRDILGARRRLLFVEGTVNSLDKPLYDLIFPGVTVVPKGSFKNVENAVTGIRDTNSLHRIDAYGIVDRDGRGDENVNQLRKKGIYPLAFYSVESIYYSREMQKKICAMVAGVSEKESKIRLKKAEGKALMVIGKNIERLVRVVAEHQIREMIPKDLSKLSKQDLYEPAVAISINTGEIMINELQRLNEYIEKRDLDSIIARYPVGKSPLKHIAEELGFKSRKFYEDAVLTLLKNNQQLLDHIRTRFEPLPDILSDQSQSS